MPPGALPTPASVAMRGLYLYGQTQVAGHPSGGEPLDQDDVLARTLYLYGQPAVHGQPSGGEPMDADDVLARFLYLYGVVIHDRDPSDVAMRSVYLYGEYTNDEPFPWLMDIRPREQFPGGEVSLYGDGFGVAQATEGSSVRLGVYDPGVPGPGQLMGVVSWSARSPNLWPANSGLPILPAIVVTVPADAESGMVSVEETI
jgi:hypothetical protein